MRKKRKPEPGIYTEAITIRLSEKEIRNLDNLIDTEELGKNQSEVIRSLINKENED